jgi:putative hydrolase of the HAD superfamily
MTQTKIKVLLSDLGGVLLTNGWDRKCRERASQTFNLDQKEFESRHQLLFGDYECGKISLATYLQYTVFYETRSFSEQSFVEFMYAQSQPFPEMIDLIQKTKAQYGLRLVSLSNEGRELTNYRINTFGLKTFFDFFLVSCFLGIRKPDKHVWEMALDFIQVVPEEVVYIDDRKLFTEIAQNMGMHAIHHQSIETTAATLQRLCS